MFPRRILHSSPNSEGALKRRDLKQDDVSISKLDKVPSRPLSSQGTTRIGKGYKRSKSDSCLDFQASKKRKPLEDPRNVSKIPFTIHEDVSEEAEKTQALVYIPDENGIIQSVPKPNDLVEEKIGQASAEPDWRVLAEERRIALEESLAENRQLHEMLQALKEENLRLTDISAEVNLLTEFIEKNMEHLLPPASGEDS